MKKLRKENKTTMSRYKSELLLRKKSELFPQRDGGRRGEEWGGLRKTKPKTKAKKSSKVCLCVSDMTENQPEGPLIPSSLAEIAESPPEFQNGAFSSFF